MNFGTPTGLPVASWALEIDLMVLDGVEVQWRLSKQN